MRNLRMLIQYDGTRYLGWQRQMEEDPANPRTIQGKLEEVLSRLAGQRIAVIGACRTDAGVHAEGQVANFHTSSPLTTEDILAYFYRYLPEDIVVKKVQEVDLRFHSRYLAGRKRYVYRICNRRFHDVFRRRYCLHLPEPLNIPAMRQAAEALIGEHDFRSFTSLKSKKKSTVRILYALELAEKEGWVELYFEGSGFLHNMIRIITGTLLEAGLGRIEPAAMKHILEKRERGAAGPLAPPQGLCLLEVLF